MSKKRVLFIVGPTAVGKTAFAIKIAEATRGEIISADSMQAYKGMGIVSQGPTSSEKKRIKHHLISFLKPENEYSAAIFAQMARKKIKDTIKRGKTPIVVGGSGLYIKALADGIFPSKGKSEKIRKSLKGLAEKNGNVFLHKRLEKIDPVSAAKIHPNDTKRIIRALEIYELEKKTKTSLKKKTKGIKDEYDTEIFGLIMDRGLLYRKIEKRIDLMFKNGLVREVEKLLRKNLSITARQALGIKEVEGYLNKTYSLQEAKEMLKKNTRRFAKRQLTWFRADKGIKWIDIEGEGKGKNRDSYYLFHSRRLNK